MTRPLPVGSSAPSRSDKQYFRRRGLAHWSRRRERRFHSLRRVLRQAAVPVRRPAAPRARTRAAKELRSSLGTGDRLRDRAVGADRVPSAIPPDSEAAGGSPMADGAGRSPVHACSHSHRVASRHRSALLTERALEAPASALPPLAGTGQGRDSTAPVLLTELALEAPASALPPFCGNWAGAGLHGAGASDAGVWVSGTGCCFLY